jgi:hypothetical protein
LLATTNLLNVFVLQARNNHLPGCVRQQGVIADVSDDADDEEPYQVSRNGQTWWYEARQIQAA